LLYWLLQVAPFLATPLRSLAKLLKKEACTRILCQDYEHARFDGCVLLGSFLRIPVYASFQGGNWQQSKLEWPIRPFSLARCAGLVIASGVEQLRVVQQYGLKPAKIAQIFNPIDLSMWRGKNQAQAREQLQLDTHNKIAIWHGRIDLKRKGLDVLLQAWALVLDRVDQTAHPLHLYILGNGNDHAAFSALLKQHAMPSVTWLDSYINDRSLIASWLKAADLYVFPSRHEGFPVAPIEALACGLPLIASDAPGIPDILAHGADSGGIMVPKNDVEALAKALQLVLEDDNLRISLGKNAQTRAETAFGLENVGLQLKNFMQLS
jgi:starch synthase